MSGEKYWAKRNSKRMNEYQKDAEATIKKVNAAYGSAATEITTSMDRIFTKYATDGGFTEREAFKYLTNLESKTEIANLKRSLRGITDPGMRAEMLARINAPAYAARLTRLQATKEIANIELAKLADVSAAQMGKGLMNTAETSYYKTMFDMQQGIGTGFSFAAMPENQIREILKQNWSGKHFSKRIWKNTEKLSADLEHVLTKGFMNGASVKKMAAEMDERMGVGKYASTRLIRTETTFVANTAELAAYKEAGILEVRYLATLDGRTSPICREHDGQLVQIKDAKAGKNIPPLHANCRSTTIEIFEDDNLEDLERRALDPETGQTMTVPANMKYDDWKSVFVDKKVTYQEWLKKQKPGIIIPKAKTKAKAPKSMPAVEAKIEKPMSKGKAISLNG